MTIYFCINEVLDQIDPVKNPSTSNDKLIQVSTQKIHCNGHAEDTFTLTSSPKILDLESGDAPYQLANLIEDVPLYHVNIVLLIDAILAERHINGVIKAAITAAFRGDPVPETHEDPVPVEKNNIPNGLQHPELDRMSTEQLGLIYVGFINKLKQGYEIYGFQERIIGKHPEPFLSFYDGFMFRGIGKVKAPILIGFGIRNDHDPSLSADSYIQIGLRKAREMNVQDTHEMLWAWLESDNYQMRRCKDIHQLMTTQNLPRIPNWVRTDIFKIMEKEAMKQHFAARLQDLDPELSVLDKMPETKRLLLAYAQSKTDDTLKQLISEILSPGTAYTGAAMDFVKKARTREHEAQEARFM